MANYDVTSGSYTLRLTVNETATSTPNNTSTVTFTLTLNKNSGAGLWNNNSCPWSININGTSYSGSFTYDFRKYSSLTLKSSTTQTITHDSDGTKSISVSAYANMDNTPYVYPLNASGTLALTTIPRASDVTVSNYSIVNTTGSLSATITSKANFYHRWRWKLDDGSWSSWTNKGAINNTSATFTVANTTLLAQLPSATSGAFTIEVETHSGTAYSSATLIGTKQATCTVSVDTSKIKPSVSLGNIGINSSPISNYAVAGYSKVQSAFTATKSSGASGVTTYFTVSHGNLATKSSTSTSGTVVSNTIPSNASNYTLTIYAYAKDSRGAISDTVSKAITVYGYQPPTATLRAYRTTSSSSTNEDGAGTYAYVTFSGAVRSTVNSQNSVQSIKCTYSGSISGTATSGGHYALADNQAVTFTLTVTDKVISSTAVVNITSAIYPLDLVDYGAGAVGVGLGMTAELNMIRFGLNTHVYNDKYFIYHRADNSTIALTNGQVLNSTRGSATSVSDLVTMASDVGTNIPFVCSPTIALSNTLSGYSQTGIFIGKKVDGADRIDYLILAGNGNALAYGTINTNNSSVSYKQVAITDDVYYKSGDTVNISGNMVLSGQVSGRVVSFFLPMEKRLTNISSVNITALTLTIRGVLGYLNGMSAAGVDFTDSSYTKSISIRPSGLYFSITFGSAITNFTNNSPVAVYVQSLGVTLN